MSASTELSPLGSALQLFGFHLGDICDGNFVEAANDLRVAGRHATAGCVAAGFYFIPECLFGWFSESFAKLTKRSAKLGTECPTYANHGIDVRRIETLYSSYDRAYVMISVQGEAPRVEGARLLARIEHTEAGNIVSAAPGVDADPAWSLIDRRCDHCNTERKRIDTFAVEVEGSVKFIGRNCLADFVRSADVASALQIWKFLELVSKASGGDPDDDWDSCGYSYEGPTPVWFVACAARAIRAAGYLKRGSEGLTTAGMADFACMPKHMVSDGRRKDWEDAQPTEMDVALAARAAKWIGETTEVGGFLGNCRVVMAQPMLKPKHLGLAAAVVVGYRKQMEREAYEAEKAARAAARKAEAPAGHFGEVGKRYNLTALRIVMVRSWEGNYGTTTLLKLKGPEGHTFSWFASGEKEYEAGQIVSGKATVKKHDSDEKYGDQTVLTRCKFEVQETETA